MPSVQVSVPTAAFGRWLQRAHVTLPVPLNATYAARVPFSIEDLVEFGQQRMAVRNAQAKDAASELPAAARKVVAEVEALLRAPEVVVYATRSTGGETLTVAGLMKGSRAVLLTDTKDEVTLRPVAAVDVTDGLVRALPTMRGAGIPVVELNQAALTALSASGGALTKEARRAADRAGVDETTLHTLFRVQAEVRALGMFGALRVGGPIAVDPPGADWVEGPYGAILKRSVAPGRVRFESADRSSLTSALVAAVAAVA